MKSRCSLSNDAQEDLLRLRGTTVSGDIEYYKSAMERFLNEYVDGSSRKRSRHTYGHNYPGNRKSQRKERNNVSAIVQNLVSSEEDSSGDEMLPSQIDLNTMSDDQRIDDSSEE